MRSRDISRQNKGNVIALVLAVFLALLIPLLLFSLWYVRMIGSHQEQTTAIQSAALAAAEDLGRITIDDPNYGLIGLSDYGPAAPSTDATDGQALPVRGMNSLLATVRLDMIIADQIGDATMKSLAQQDYTNAMEAQQRLTRTLTSAVTSETADGTFKDLDNNPINPYKDALNAYKTNVIRMTGSVNSLKEGSFKLTLGYLTVPGNTNTPIPQPETYANLNADAIGNSANAQGTSIHTYKSYVNAPYAGNPFVFAGTDSQVRLVDHSAFTSSLNGLPYAIPAIVRADGDQVFAGGSNAGIVHAMACAQAASVYDPRPAPGALKISFLDGAVPEFVKPGDLLTSPILNNNHPVTATPDHGDYPGSSLTPITTVPGLGHNPLLGQVNSKSIFDWLKRAGAKADVKAVSNMMLVQAMSTSSRPHSEAYVFQADGTIRYASLDYTAQKNHNTKTMGSNKQLYSQTGLPVISTDPVTKVTTPYSIVTSDAVMTAGKTNGGIHGGEPLTDLSLTSSTALIIKNIASKPVNPLEDGNLAVAYSGLILAGLSLALFRRKNNMPAMLGGLIILTSATGLVVTLSACDSGDDGAHHESYTPVPVPVGARIPRDTYTSNGMATEIGIRKFVP